MGSAVTMAQGIVRFRRRRCADVDVKGETEPKGEGKRVPIRCPKVRWVVVGGRREGEGQRERGRSFSHFSFGWKSNGATLFWPPVSLTWETWAQGPPPPGPRRSEPWLRSGQRWRQWWRRRRRGARAGGPARPGPGRRRRGGRASGGGRAAGRGRGARCPATGGWPPWRPGRSPPSAGGPAAWPGARAGAPGRRGRGSRQEPGGPWRLEGGTGPRMPASAAAAETGEMVLGGVEEKVLVGAAAVVVVGIRRRVAGSSSLSPPPPVAAPCPCVCPASRRTR